MKYKLRAISVCLWILAGIALIYVYWYRNDTGKQNAEVAVTLLRETPWKHFPSVPKFEMTDQTGQKFNSAELAGKPYAVNIFFSNCKKSCWALNQQVKRLGDQFENDDVNFVSITCDPKNDTPEVLNEYATRLEADPKRWKFLTAPMYQIQQLSSQAFFVNLEPNSHTQKIMLVDKWGRFRDFFEYDDNDEMKRFSTVMKTLLAETEPPIDEAFLSRNQMAASDLTRGTKTKWVREFELVDSNGERFYSRDMTGKVWLVNFFFSKCPTICPRMNEYAQTLLTRMSDQSIELASITVDPINDDSATLRQYIKTRNFDNDRWHFLTTEDPIYVQRIGSEFFQGELAEGENHSAMICIIDRWGNLRGKYNWNFPDAEADVISFCRKLAGENAPPAKWDVVQFGKSDEQSTENEQGED